MTPPKVSTKRRPFTVTAFCDPGEIGQGGIGYRVGTSYGSEEAAIAIAKKHAAEIYFQDRPHRYLVKKNAAEVCWLDSENQVVRRDLEALPFGAGLWGYAS